MLKDSEGFSCSSDLKMWTTAVCVSRTKKARSANVSGRNLLLVLAGIIIPRLY